MTMPLKTTVSVHKSKQAECTMDHVVIVAIQQLLHRW